VIAATNSDLERKVAAGNFREDLYHLLDGAILRVPPLRERRDDIPALAVYFLRKHQPHGRRLRFSGAAERALFNYSWPGNVREMENRVRCAAMFGPGNTIRPKDLRLDPVAWSAGLVEDPAPARGDLEREEIGRAMQATGEDSVLVTNLLWVGKMGKWGPKKGSA
jgi:transcriptional regulator with GAF, ATPase, and Fis domain